MGGWIARTESGTKYIRQVHGGILRSDGSYFHNPHLRLFTVESLPQAIQKTTSQSELLEHLLSLPLALKPEVGKRMFIWTFGDSGWQISTTVVSIEELP